MIAPKGKGGGQVSEIHKVKEATEIQRHETERIKLKQEALDAEQHISRVEDLVSREELVVQKESELNKGKSDWDNLKATEQSEIQKQKAELDAQRDDIKRQLQDIAMREANLEIREQLITEREQLLNKVEIKNLQEEERYNSLTEQLRRAFPQIIYFLKENANELIRVGFNDMGQDIWDDIEQMEGWFSNELESHCNDMVKLIRREVEDCNSKAVLMYRQRKRFGVFGYNKIVDNLEKIYGLLPMVKPEYLPSDMEINVKPENHSKA